MEPWQARRELWAQLVAKLVRPRELVASLRYRLGEGNEYPYFDLVDFFPGVGEALARLGPTRVDFEAPIFLAGLRRSGTTLFYRVMNAHPDLHLYNERFPGDRLNGAGLPTIHNVWSVADEAEFRQIVRRYLSPARRWRSGRWGAKLPLHLVHPAPSSVSATGFQRLMGAFPRARFLCIVRDPRDFVLSALRRGGRTLEHWVAEYRATADLLCAHVERHADRVRIVHYEELVADPKKVIEECCEFVELRFEERMLDPSRWSIKGPKEYDRSMIVENTEKWRKVAGEQPDLIDRIERGCFPSAARIGYERAAACQGNG